MNFLKALIVILAAAVVGYLAEPHLRPYLIPRSDAADEAGMVPIPDWVAGLEPGQLPDKVGLTRNTMVRMPESPEPVELPAGTRLRTVRVEGEELVVNPFQGAVETSVPIHATDLLELLGDEAPEPRPEVLPVIPPPGGEPADPPSETEGTEPAEEAMPEEVPAVAGEAEALPAEEAPAAEEVPAVEEVPAAEEVPAVEEPAEETGPVVLDDAQIVALMQEAVRGGTIAEFGLDQVQSWEAGGETEYDGESWQSGLLVYRAETPFGVTKIQAQALIRDGRIARWIWPKSGMEIK